MPNYLYSQRSLAAIKTLFVVFFVLINLSLMAQRRGTSPTPPQASQPIPQATQRPAKKAPENPNMLMYGITAHTNATLLGAGSYQRTLGEGSFLGRDSKHFLALELAQINSNREYKEPITLTSDEIKKKKNYFFVLRPEYGKIVQIFKKNYTTNDNVGLNFLVAVGPSIGIEKPYYVLYKNTVTKQTFTGPYTPEIEATGNRVVGQGGKLEGLSDSKIIVGGHLKLATQFNISPVENSFFGFETGIVLEAFSRAPDLVAFVENPKSFASLYISLVMGREKSKK